MELSTPTWGQKWDHIIVSLSSAINEQDRVSKKKLLKVRIQRKRKPNVISIFTTWERMTKVNWPAKYLHEIMPRNSLNLLVSMSFLSQGEMARANTQDGSQSHIEGVTVSATPPWSGIMHDEVSVRIYNISHSIGGSRPLVSMKCCCRCSRGKTVIMDCRGT